MERCPGPGSENAGTAESCRGCPNARTCSSSRPDPDIQLIKDRLKSVKIIVVVLSGKGGVGKSTVSTGIAHALSKLSLSTLLLDWDFSGPSIPRMTNTMNSGIAHSSNNNGNNSGNNSDNNSDNSNSFDPVRAADNLSVLSVGHFEVLEGESSSYNTATKNRIAKEMLKNCNMRGIDAIVIDTPPNITEEHLIIANCIDVTCAVIVTTPQKLALNDVKRQIAFCKKTGVPISGVVENMKDLECTKCGHFISVFSHTGVEKYCEENDLLYLGSLPLQKGIAKGSDEGQLPSAELFDEIAAKLYVQFIN